jgi:alpha-L-rhamnosidase
MNKLPHIAIILLLILLSWIAVILPSSAQNASTPASYVWVDETGEGRQVYVYFRNEFELGSRPEKAEINLYASSRFALWVNGRYINFGPIRSYPQHPYYDTFDIAPYLKEGKNFISVKTMLNGMETFQLPYHTGAFIAWGEITTGNQNISLATPGNWLCREAQGYHPHAPRFSFAKGPIEVFDTRSEPDIFLSTEIIKESWKNPAILSDQKAYGQLMQRTIPYLTQDIVIPKFAVNRLDISTSENIYHFDVVGNDRMHENYGANPPVIGYTYLYSPNEQEVAAGFSWGNFWLNGEKVELTADSSKPFRNKARLKLKQGWNLLFTRQQLLWGSLHTLVAIPKNTGIAVSPGKRMNDPVFWKVSCPLLPEENQLTGDPAQPLENPQNIPLNWKDYGMNDGMANPARELVWQDSKKQSVDPYKISDFEIPAGTDQAYIFDLGGIHLGRIFIEVDAPEGTIFDLTWSEDLRDSLVTLYKRLQINAIARFISQDGRQYFETFKPYGLRYLQVTVRNHKDPVTLYQAGIIRQEYPFEKRGSFACSDPLLNDIWEMGWRSLLPCSEDSYTDTPFRERGHYAGDLFPQFALTLATSGDPLLAKHTIRMITDMYEKTYRHEMEVRHADYPVINILVAAWLSRMYQDWDFARELYPVFNRFLEGCYERKGSDGLYHTNRVFFEWIEIDKEATLTSYQTNIYAAFHEMAFLAEKLGKNADALKYRKWANETAEMIRNKFWDPASGNFFDGIKNGKFLETRFPGSSTYPSLWGITTFEQDFHLAEYFADALINIGPPVNRKQLTTPYGGFYALASLYRNGNAALAEQFIRKHWGKMVLEANDLTWEDFNRSDHSTMSHAWSASPTYYLSSEVLGVNLGFPLQLSPDTIYIMPQSETLQWARGTVPHPAGDISVSWRIAGDNLFLLYQTPPDIPVVVKPRGRLSRYKLIIN